MLSVCHVSFNISVMIRTSGHVLRIRRGSFALRKIRGIICQTQELQCTLDSPSLDCSMLRFFRSLALQSVLFVSRFQNSIELLACLCRCVFQTWLYFISAVFMCYCVLFCDSSRDLNPYPTAFPYGNDMVLHFYQQQESSTTKTVHKVINKGLKAYV